MTSAAPQLDRLLALLADRATQGLSAQHAGELRDLLEAFPELDEEVLDRTAAQIDVALTPEEPKALPPGLRRTLLADLDAAFAAPEPEEPAEEPAELLPEADLLVPAEAPAEPRPAGAGRVFGRLRPWLPHAGWAVAALALLLALSGPRGDPPPATLAGAGDVRLMAWLISPDAEGRRAEGELLWSAQRQAGVARLRGLAPNDPARGRYQLWIVDAGRGRRAVPSGLFDVPAGARTVEAPMVPALPIERPARFVITLEEPGGTLTTSFERSVAEVRVE